MGLKLQLRRSWSSYEGFRIVAACQNWDGCCCFGQKWGRGGGGARRIYIAGDRDGKPCRNSSIPSITSRATATLSSITLFHSSALCLSPLSLSLFHYDTQAISSVEILHILARANLDTVRQWLECSYVTNCNKKWSSNSAKYLVSESSYEPRSFLISYKCCPLHRVSRSTSATKALSFTLDKVQIQNFTGHETLRCPRYPGYQLLPLGNCEQTPGQDCNVTTIRNVIYHLTVTARFSHTGVVWRTSVLHHQCDCTAWWITFKNLRYRLQK